MAATEIPFDRFAQFRRYFGLGFHPKGDILYTSDVTGQYNLWRQPVAAGGVPGYPRLLTAFTDRVVRDFYCAEDGKSVFYSADKNGDEYYQIFRLWFDRGVTETITDAPTVQHFLAPGAILASNGEFLYADNGRTAAEVDVVVHNLRSGKTSRPFPTGNIWAVPRFDPARRRIAAVQFISNQEQHTHILDRRRGSTEEILPHSGDGSVVPIDFTRDGRGIFLLSDVDAEFKRLLLHFPSTGKTHVLAAHQGDIEQVSHAPRSRTLAYAVNLGGYHEVYAGRAGGRFRRVAIPEGAVPPGIWGVQFDLSPNGRFAATLWGNGTAPPEILWIPLAGGSPRYVTDGMVGGVPGAPLAPPRLVRIEGPGGRTIPAWYYIPKPRPKGPVAAVLSIHGGPNMQERPAWSSSGLYQFLNSRGIAVLAPNVRGSSGYGRAYEEEIHRDWGGGDLEDFRACAEWLKHRPEIDAGRLAVFGGSFGGFASLSCLTRLPEYWKVGVDIFGPSNLVTFLRTIPPSWKKGFDIMLGDPDRDRDFLLSRSPITYLDHLRADLLVIQGGKDPRVVKAESDQLVERLRAAGRNVDYVVFEDEGHGFSRHENTLKAYTRVASFLVEHLRPAT